MVPGTGSGRRGPRIEKITTSDVWVPAARKQKSAGRFATWSSSRGRLPAPGGRQKELARGEERGLGPDIRCRVFFNTRSQEVPTTSLEPAFRPESFFDGPGARPEAKISGQQKRRDLFRTSEVWVPLPPIASSWAQISIQPRGRRSTRRGSRTEDKEKDKALGEMSRPRRLPLRALLASLR